MHPTTHNYVKWIWIREKMHTDAERQRQHRVRSFVAFTDLFCAHEAHSNLPYTRKNDGHLTNDVRFLCLSSNYHEMRQNMLLKILLKISSRRFVEWIRIFLTLSWRVYDQ